MILQALLLALEFLRFFPSDLSKQRGREETVLCGAREWSAKGCTREGTEKLEGSILLTTMLICFTESAAALPENEVRPEGSDLALKGLVPLFVLCTDRLL